MTAMTFWHQLIMWVLNSRCHLDFIVALSSGPLLEERCAKILSLVFPIGRDERGWAVLFPKKSVVWWGAYCVLLEYSPRWWGMWSFSGKPLVCVSFLPLRWVVTPQPFVVSVVLHVNPIFILRCCFLWLRAVVLNLGHNPFGSHMSDSLHIRYLHYKS